MSPRDLKARLAREIITRLRGADAAAAAEDHFDRVFRRHEAAADLQELALEPADVEEAATSSCPPCWSAGSARRAPSGGGASSRAASASTASLWRASPSPPPSSAGRRLKAGKSATGRRGVIKGL